MTWMLLMLGACGGGAAETDKTDETPSEQTEPTDTGSAVQREVVTDRFTQGGLQPVDLLLIVDNSCSMSDDQQLLGRSFDELILPYLDREIDLRVGLISTDMEAPDQTGKLLPTSSGALWYDGSEPQFGDEFSRWVSLGAAGSGTERGLDAISVSFLEPANAGFIRPEARLDMLLLSDEEDQSFIQPDAFIQGITTVKGSAEVVRFDLILTLPGEEDPFMGTSAGLRYIEAQDAFGGELISINGDWRPQLSALAESVPLPESTWPLSVLPDPATIAVEVLQEGVEIEVPAESWSWDEPGNAVIFSSWLPPTGAEIVVTYNPA